MRHSDREIQKGSVACPIADVAVSHAAFCLQMPRMIS